MDLDNHGREQCLIYFRQAVHEPRDVPPWSEWWAQNEPVVGRAFSIVDYVRLKHRRLRGAPQILEMRGELPADFQPPDMTLTGSCSECGERINFEGVESGSGSRQCPSCGPTSA